jgi:hypothetical protein
MPSTEFSSHSVASARLREISTRLEVVRRRFRALRWAGAAHDPVLENGYLALYAEYTAACDAWETLIRDVLHSDVFKSPVCSDPSFG